MDQPPPLLTVNQFRKLLNDAGNQAITNDQIKSLIKRGLPTGKGGKISVLQACAWLTKEYLSG